MLKPQATTIPSTGDSSLLYQTPTMNGRDTGTVSKYLVEVVEVLYCTSTSNYYYYKMALRYHEEFPSI